MQRFLSLGTSVLPTYPEENPFEHDPYILNLRPYPPSEAHDTQEFRDACCAIAQKSGRNPLFGTFGTCPLYTYDPVQYSAHLPFTKYEVPPPLPRATLSAPLVFLEQINPTGNTALFTVRVGDSKDVRLLKLFRDKETCMEGYRKPEEAPPHPLERFAKEQAAYAHLLHYGACETGAVPHCYGWLECSAADLAAIAALPAIERPWQMMKHDPTPPKALLLEYFPDAERLSIDTVTPIIADKVLRALYRVHASYVLHSDIHGRNVLVLPNGRVVWIDFDASRHPRIPTPSGSPGGARPLRRQLLIDEFVRAWVHFYGELLPDKRIGFRHWLY